MPRAMGSEKYKSVVGPSHYHTYPCIFRQGVHHISRSFVPLSHRSLIRGKGRSTVAPTSSANACGGAAASACHPAKAKKLSMDLFCAPFPTEIESHQVYGCLDPEGGKQQLLRSSAKSSRSHAMRHLCSVRTTNHNIKLAAVILVRCQGSSRIIIDETNSYTSSK